MPPSPKAIDCQSFSFGSGWWPMSPTLICDWMLVVGLHLVVACREPHEFSSTPFPEDLKALLPVVWVLNLLSSSFPKPWKGVIWVFCWCLNRELSWCSWVDISLEPSLFHSGQPCIFYFPLPLFSWLAHLINNLQDPWQNQEGLSLVS